MQSLTRITGRKPNSNKCGKQFDWGTTKVTTECCSLTDTNRDEEPLPNCQYTPSETPCDTNLADMCECACYDGANAEGAELIDSVRGVVRKKLEKWVKT